VLLVARAEYAVVNAYTDWSPCFDDPTTLDLTDISSLVVKTIPFSDPMDEVRRNLLLVLRPSGRIAGVGALPEHDGRPEPNRPRAPPVA
jgi:hypothetical protein